MRDLRAARRGTHDEDPAVSNLGRIAIRLRGQRRDRWRHAGREARHARDVARARGDDDGAAPPLTAVGAQEISRTFTTHRDDGGVRAHRRRDRFRVASDEIDNLRERAVAVRVVADVAKPRQPALPIGREQTQRVPSLAAPALRGFAALEENVVDRTLREAAAHRKACVPRTYDNGGDGRHGAGPHLLAETREGRYDQFTTTVTLVGLVTIS
jgi:hypothetical protein